MSAGDDPLERHPSLDDRFDPAIRVVVYDPGWERAAAREINLLLATLGQIARRVEHIGSTAVPGLAAKPIVDIQVSVDTLEPRERYVTPLTELGYLFAADPASPGRRFFAKPAQRPRTHHVHVCLHGSDDERRHLVLRDYLRADAAERIAYAELKVRLAAAAPFDRIAYIAGKDPYVVALEARALAWADRPAR